MGQQVSESVIKRYIQQWTGLPAFPHESPAQHIERVESVDLVDLPYNTIDVVGERIPFAEAALLGRARSFLFERLEEMQDVLVVGIEASAAFTGKHSLFCAFEVENFDQLSAMFSPNSFSAQRVPRGVGIAVHATHERLIVTCPFSAFLTT